MIDKISTFLKFWGENFSTFLKADGWLVVLLIFLNLTPVFRTLIFWGTGHFKDNFLNEIPTAYFGAVVILLFCVLIYCCLSKCPRTKFFIQILILFGFTISFVIDIFTIHTFKVMFEESFVEIVLATNQNEVKEFFNAYILNSKTLVALIAFVIFVVTAIKNGRKIFKNLSDENLKRISYHTLIFLLPVVFFSFVHMCDFIFTVTYGSTTLVRNLKYVHKAMKFVGSEPEIWATMDSQNEKIISNNSKIPYVVFILGESETRNHMQLYGYNLENTPLTVERFKREELFRFNDTIACANHTSAAMKLIFNFTEKESAPEDWYKTPNIFDIVRRAGYYTAWISNQSPIGWQGNLGKIYSERCDEKYFTEAPDIHNTEIGGRILDSALLPVIDDFLSRSQEKNFYLIHLYSPHLEYRKRYPAEFAKFTAADEDKPTDEGKKITAEYDNAVLYADFILDEIFKRFEDKNALIIYISDHGEEVYENGKDFAGHSPEENGNHSTIEIPMIVWTSQKFREMYPEKVTALKNAENNPYRTDLLIHTILDLMDIQTESFNPTKSIVNEKFDKFRVRIYNNKPYIRG